MLKNAENESKKTYQLEVEKLIPKPRADVFRALGEGRLFLNCGADNENLKIDFRVGGKYALQFIAYDVTNNGEFLEIIPNEKIVFTWCQNAKISEKPDTVVTILLKDQGQQTLLHLTHTGFRDQERVEDHTGGWNGGLNDLASAMAEGKIRFHRYYEMSVKKLYAMCSTPALFFGKFGDLSKGAVDFKVGGKFKLPTEGGEVSGTFTEIVPNQKVAFSWTSTCPKGGVKDSKVTLNFDTDEGEEESWLELIHEGLTAEMQQKEHHAGWDWLLTAMRS